VPKGAKVIIKPVFAWRTTHTVCRKPQVVGALVKSCLDAGRTVQVVDYPLAARHRKPMPSAASGRAEAASE
jgi:hypothetical protein